MDARSDIFSLGSVLYELVTGQQPFQGPSKLSTLSAILKEEPKPPSTITPAIPADLEKLISRCLRKDPAKRFQHMDDVKVALEELKEESDSGKLAPRGRQRRRDSPGDRPRPSPLWPSCWLPPSGSCSSVVIEPSPHRASFP